MAIMSSKQLKTQIKSIKTNREKLQTQIHEVLVSATFYAVKDGNTEVFNQLLEAVGNATYIKGITKWAELNAPVLVREGRFTLNKTAKKEYQVESEEDFAEYEVELRAGPKWFEIVPEQRATSIWDCGDYLQGVAKTLRKHGVDSAIIAEIEKAEMIARIAKTQAEEELADEEQAAA